jgi:hypothetical protein
VLVSQNSVMLSRMSSREVARLLQTVLEDLLDDAGLTGPVAVVEHEGREVDRGVRQAVERLRTLHGAGLAGSRVPADVGLQDPVGGARLAVAVQERGIPRR